MVEALWLSLVMQILPPPLPKEVQQGRGGVGGGAVAPGHGPGVDLEDHVPTRQGVQGLPGGGEVPGVSLVEEPPALVELGHQIKMAHDLTARFFRYLRHPGA